MVKHGTGAINIDECRIGNEERTHKGMSSLGLMHDDDWKPNGGYRNHITRQISSKRNTRWTARGVASYFYFKTSTEERNTGLIGREAGQYSCDGRNKQIENPYQRNQSVAQNTSSDSQARRAYEISM